MNVLVIFSVVMMMTDNQPKVCGLWWLASDGLHNHMQQRLDLLLPLESLDRTSRARPDFDFQARGVRFQENEHDADARDAIPSQTPTDSNEQSANVKF
ncbi:hypothetical protein DAPPUDRAFT_235552 [Daphnia pulex]|uniref:Uncharacterized protein n=1 Tax=Daphnia pulex TaxID=6669 RepID=E9G062_DAPPU|nr:hypothetical protein DAPPUDRAFT_235552 [Daphnia pulex]|eukprot:EFX86846.1 hypothetical protein DAPPUDRAFT_235552 [Daphnia pulex]